MKTILSIDGGGMRGILPALLLATLESKTGKRCYKLFDMIAGTSTGGILALALARPKTPGGSPYYAADLVDLYRTRGKDIFDRSAAYTIESGDGLAGPKYRASGIEAVLQQYFGDTKLSESLTPTLITSYDAAEPGPAIFKSWKDPVNLMKDVARATSAAPTYFPPLQLGDGLFIDGGVFANNPSMCAWASASEIFGGDRDIMVVSVGTGNTEKKLDPRGWGLAKWAPSLVDIFMDGNSDTVDYQMKEVIGKLQWRYFRFQVDLGSVTDAMDDASPKTVNALMGLAQQMLLNNSEAMEELIKAMSLYKGNS